MQLLLGILSLLSFFLSLTGWVVKNIWLVSVFSTAQGKHAWSVQEGTRGVHAGCMGQARGCAASVHAVCKERMHRACKRTCGAHGENAHGARS